MASNINFASQVLDYSRNFVHAVNDAFPTLRNELVVYLDSSSLENLISVSIKNIIDNAATENEFRPRSRYAENFMQSIAASIYNLAMSIISGAACAVTLGKNEDVMAFFQRHIIHTALSISSSLISILGVIHPTAAATATLGLSAYLFQRVTAGLEDEAVRGVRNLFERYRTEIFDIVNHSVADDNPGNAELIMAGLEQRVRSMRDLSDLANLFDNTIN